MTQQKDTYALLLPFTWQDVPRGASAADLSSSQGAAVALAPSGGCAQRSRRIMVGVAALLLVTLLMIALLAAHPSSSRGTSGPEARVMLAKSGPVDMVAVVVKTPEEDSDCHTATHGEACYSDVVEAMKDQSKHPEWYAGLSSESTFADFQAFLHGQAIIQRCPKPCTTTDHRSEEKGHGVHRSKSAGINSPDAARDLLSEEKGHGVRRSKPEGTNSPDAARDLGSEERGHEAHGSKSAGTKRSRCHTAVFGEECYKHVIHTKWQAIRYPTWYPGFSRKSRVEDVQRYLHREGVCPAPCEPAGEEQEAGAGLLEERSATECHTALPGETCYSDILFAIDDIAQHPGWYPGLTNYSAREHFQAFLHSQSYADEEAERRRCPLPCDRGAVEEVGLRAACDTASESGEACYEGVRWAATVGIREHPSWYPNLSRSSSLEAFQLHLHGLPKTECPKRPCPCHTHVEGEACYDSVMWIRRVGLHKHPGSWGGLTSASSFEEIQAHLHAERITPCLRPCAPLPW